MNLTLLAAALSNDEKEQLFSILEPKDKTRFTPIEGFCRYVPMSTRLKNVLLNNKDKLGDYVELIDACKIAKMRWASKNTQDEFVKLRGY